jgi:imidazolonepropionase-like amidohydrolase
MTVEAAGACGVKDAGTLAEGGRADLVLWDHDDPRVFAYALGAVRPALVLVGGGVALEAGMRLALLA